MLAYNYKKVNSVKSAEINLFANKNLNFNQNEFISF